MSIPADLYPWAYLPRGRLVMCMLESGRIFSYRVRVTRFKGLA